MSTAIVKANEVDQWADQEMINTLKDTVCKGATNAQFRMFAEVCKSTGLSPWLKEIWFVPGVGVMAGRDGYLRVANEHPMFDGMETRVERDAKNLPVKAVCQVWRKDRSHPITCEAYFNEYKRSGGVWEKYPSAMIQKVAEVLALKRSFSINGVVTEEEGVEPEPTRAEKVEAAQNVAAEKLARMKGEPPPVHDAQFVDEPPMLEAPAAPPMPKADLKHFKDIKAQFQALGAEQRYYSVLKQYGVEKSNQFNDIETAREAYKALGKALQAVRLEVADREETDKAYAALVAKHGSEVDRLIGVMGYESWDAVPLAARDGLLAMLRKELV